MGVQRLIQRQIGQAAADDVGLAQAGLDVFLQARLQRLGRGGEGDQMQLHIPQGQPGEQPVQDLLPVHHPAKDHIVTDAALQKIA